jgi:glycopeptide antibiotics resistance protein
VLSANALLIGVGVVMIVIVLIGRARGVSGPAIVARCALAGAVAWIFAITLFPIPIDARWWEFHRHFSHMTLSPFRTIGSQLAHGLDRSEAQQLIGNMALFVPLGLSLPASVRMCRRLWATLVGAALLSVLIECVQALVPGHTTDVDDVILNTAGAALGYLVFWIIARTGTRRSRAARRRSGLISTSPEGRERTLG